MSAMDEQKEKKEERKKNCSHELNAAIGKSTIPDNPITHRMEAGDPRGKRGKSRTKGKT